MDFIFRDHEMDCEINLFIFLTNFDNENYEIN